MKFKFLENEATADIAFEAYGKTLEQAFENSALAVFEIITDTKKVQPKLKKEIELKAHDLKSLLYDFIEELLYIQDTENLLFSQFKVKPIEKIKEEYLLKAEIKGEKFNEKIHEKRNMIKSVTYFGMEIKQEKEYCTIKVTIDV